MRMQVLPALLVLFACAAYGQDLNRIDGKQNGSTDSGSSFNATTGQPQYLLARGNALDHFQPPPQERIALEQMPSPRLRHLYAASLLFAVSANAMDIASSYGKPELNPMLQGSGGRFDATSVLRKSAFVAALELPQFFVSHKTSRRMKVMSIANFAVGAALIGIARHNFGIAAADRSTH